MTRPLITKLRLTALAAALLAAPLLGGACGLSGTRPAADRTIAQPGMPAPTMLFVNITSGKSEPHAVAMALDLATQALNQDQEVVLFFNVAAASIPTRSLPEDLGIEGISIRQRLQELMARGALVLVCPHCMHYLGVSESELLPGAVVASSDLLFSKLGPDTVVFTY